MMKLMAMMMVICRFHVEHCRGMLVRIAIGSVDILKINVHAIKPICTVYMLCSYVHNASKISLY